MTEEEIYFAKVYNAGEGEIAEFEEIAATEDCSEIAEEESNLEVSCCVHCQVSHEERISDFKKHQNMHESGLEIEYRCPRCRDCVECQSAD